MGDYERKKSAARAKAPTDASDVGRAIGKRVQPQSEPARASTASYKGTVFDGTVPWSGNERGGTDPLLTVSKPRVEFAKTVVGASSQEEVTIRNNDTRAIAVDGVAPMLLDPFDQFRARQHSSVLLQPGASKQITLEFRPAHAGPSMQRLALITGLGSVGPEGELRASGEGIDVPYSGAAGSSDRDHRMASADATRARIEEQSRDIVAASRAKDALHRQRAQAAEAVRVWQQRALSFNHSLARWTLRNWIHFLGKTGGDHELHGSGQVVDLWRRGAYLGLKKGAASGIEGLLGMAKRSVQAAAILEYPVFGIAIAQAIDKLSDFVLDKVGLKPEKPEEESDRHALAATTSVARTMLGKADDIAAYESRANLVIDDIASSAELKIAQTDDAGEVAAWSRWAIDEAAKVGSKDESDLRFSDQLLRQWVLEHAGSTKAANARTNPKAWIAARDDLKRRGVLKSVEQTNLFVHQCAQEWGMLGLAEANDASAVLDIRRKTLEAQSRGWGNVNDELAAMIAMELNGALSTFRRSDDARRTASEFGRLDRRLDVDADGLLAFQSDFAVNCRVWLAAEGKGVCVKHFTYDVSAPRLGIESTRLVRSPLKQP